MADVARFIAKQASYKHLLQANFRSFVVVVVAFIPVPGKTFCQGPAYTQNQYFITKTT